MHTPLFIRLGESPNDDVEWFAADATPSFGTGPLTGLSARATKRRVIVTVPGSHVLLARVQVPSVKPHYIRQAVPFQLEDRVAHDVSALHFAIGARDALGEVAVAVVDDALFEGWFAALQASGIMVHALLPDVLCLPLSEGSWSIACDTRQAMVRTGPLAGFACDAENLPTLLAARLARETDRPEKLVAYGEAAQRAASGAWDGSVELQAATHPLQLCAEHWPGKAAIDLRQGRYAPGADQIETWHRWRVPIALAGCLMLLLFGERVWHHQQLKASARLLEQQSATLYREAFPETQRIVDPVAQMRQGLAELRRGTNQDHFLALLSSASQQLEVLQGGEVIGLEYRDGLLQLQLQLPTFDHFDRLRDALVAEGEFQVEIGSLGSENGTIRGPITIRKAAS